MSTFTEIYTNIQAVMGRPELQTYIQSRINAAIRFISASGEFEDDLVEIVLGAVEGIVPTANVQLVTLPTGFRSVMYIDYPDPTNTLSIDSLNLSDLGHRDTRFKSNLYYTAGNKLHIKHDTKTSEFILGYLATPTALSGVQTNWITDRVPELVEEICISALRIILGDVEAASYISRLTEMQLKTHVQDIITKSVSSVYSGRS